MRRFVAWLVLAAAVLAVAVPAAANPQRQAATVQVQLLTLSEFHGNLAPPGGSGGLVQGVPAGGIEYLGTALKQLDAANPNTITVSSGDNIGASPLVSALFHDEPTIDALSQMGVEYSSVGNHEFDEGVAELKRMQNGGCHPKDGCTFESSFAGATFKYLAANVLAPPTAAQLAAVAKYNAAQKAKLATHKRFCARKANKPKATCKRPFKIKLKAKPTAQPLFPPYAVKTVGGVKVGFIGEVLKETPTIVTPSGVAGLKFLPEAETANTYAAVLKKLGVRAIVLLMHQGDLGSADPNTCGTAGDLTPIVKALSPDIDAVVAGHVSTGSICQVGPQLVVQAVGAGRTVGKIDLTIDTATDEVVSKTAKQVVVTRDVAKDPAMTAILTKAQQESAPLANRVVGSISADITRAGNAAGESALGDVIADAQLEATKAANKGGAVVAFMNPGGIRTDLLVNQQSGGEQPGQVTYGEAFAVQPFSNVMYVETMTGDQIKRLLEQQFDNPSTGQDRILQVSNGFTYSYDRTKPAGQRVDVTSIKIGGTAVVAGTQYRVAMNNFLQGGGDNFTVFKEGTNLLGGDIDLDAFVAYLTAKAPVAPGPRDRITRTA